MNKNEKLLNALIEFHNNNKLDELEKVDVSNVIDIIRLKIINQKSKN